MLLGDEFANVSDLKALILANFKTFSTEMPQGR